MAGLAGLRRDRWGIDGGRAAGGPAGTIPLAFRDASGSVLGGSALCDGARGTCLRLAAVPGGAARGDDDEGWTMSYSTVGLTRDGDPAWALSMMDVTPMPR